MFSVFLPLVAELSAAASLPVLPESRLSACITQARADITAAIVTADDWLAREKGRERAYPLQCLGIAYTSLMRWDEAEEMFVAARDALPADSELAWRAKLAGMAANAALADQRPGAALMMLDAASAEARGAGEVGMAGTFEIDRARALVALDRLDEAEAALNTARRDAAQSPEGWMLSATLARRMGKLEDAQFFIETASGMNPVDLEIGLEAGLIAALSGRDDAARKSWQSVADAAPGSDLALRAQDYLKQLEQP